MASDPVTLLVSLTLLLMTMVALVILGQLRDTALPPRRAPSPWRTSDRRDGVTADLRTAIAAGQVEPRFEPQVDLGSGRLVGFAVHAHWSDPASPLPAAADVMVLAERCGVIGDLSLSLMRQAFAAAQDWNAALSLSIGLASQQLRDPWLAQKIIKAMVETGFPASRLEITIDAASLGEELPLAPSIAASLRNQGVRITLCVADPDWSGASPVRFDAIAVVPALLARPAAAARVIRAADRIDRSAAAHGVATASSAEQARILGFTFAKGRHFGEPSPAASVRQMLAEKRLLGHAPDAASGRFALHLQAG